MDILNQWDDNLIINAYDKSMELVNKQVKDLMNEDKLIINDNKNKWKIGDYCQAIYKEDGKLYEAEIISIDNDNCTIRYIGYLNEEIHKLDDLLISAGDINRKNQEEQCLKESIDNLSFTTEQSINLNDKESNIDNSNLNNSQQNSKTLFNQSNLRLQSNLNNQQILIPPPPSALPNLANQDENELLSTSLISWYMSGYHTGYYQAIKDLKNLSSKK